MRVSQIFGNDTMNRGIQIESAGDPNAKASSSTATGLGQYLNQSWLGGLYEYGPLNLAKRIKKSGKKWIVPDGGERAILDMRKAAGKPELLKLNIDIMTRDWEGHTRTLGKGWNDGDLYLCHFLGPGAAKKLLRADQNATAVSVAGEAAANANPTIFYKNFKHEGKAHPVSCGALRSWAATSMRTRWDNAGRPDWIAKYYPQNAHPDPEPVEVPEDRPPMKLDVPEREESDDAARELPDAAEPAPAPVPLPRPRPTPPRSLPTVPPGAVMKGDPEIWWVEFRLKAMHYYMGVLDGGYGGKLAGAIAGFVNDRKETITPPNDHESFLAILDELKDALDRAERDGFERPVTKERKEGQREVVDEVAPEAKPVRRNFITGLIASALASVSAIFNGLKDSVGEAWSFFFSHKDDIPDEVTSGATSWLGSVPGWVWLVGAAAIFLLFAFNSGSGLKQIIDKVKSGER